MSTSTCDRAKYRRSRYQIIDFRTSNIAGGSSHDPSHGQDQTPDEISGRDTCRGFLFASEAGKGKPYHDRIYEVRWLEGKDIGNKQTLAEIANRCGLDRYTFLEAITQQRPYEQELQRCNAEAEADGVFGFPFFVHKGHKFWGNDRIEWLVQEVQKHR